MHVINYHQYLRIYNKFPQKTGQKRRYNIFFLSKKYFTQNLSFELFEFDFNLEPSIYNIFVLQLNACGHNVSAKD